MMKINITLRNNRSWLFDCLFLFIFLCFFYFIFLGERPLLVPDEGRYAEIAREMFNRGDYITPYLNNIKYFEKPALFYWLLVIAIKIGGLNLWSLRSVNVLIAIGGCLATYLTARKLYGRLTGLLATALLSTSALYFFMAHIINMDMGITVSLSLTLYSFILGIHYPIGNKRRMLMWIAAFFAAASVLMKGLIGIALPVLIIAVWLSLISEWRLIKKIYLPSSFIIFLLIVTPWHVLVGYKNPEFWNFYFYEQHILRYLKPGVGHEQPWWFFVVYLIIGAFPWIIFLPEAAMSAIKQYIKQSKARVGNSPITNPYQVELFFLLWIILIFLFFSFSASKLIPYILPIFPPLSILIARYLIDLTHRSKPHLSIKLSYGALICLSIFISYAFFQFTKNANLPDPKLARLLLNTASLILLTGNIISFFYIYRNWYKAFFILFFTTILFLICISASLPSIDTRTILPIANQLKSILKPEDEVISFNQYYQDLPFYLERQISVVNWKNELSFGMKHQNTKQWMLSDGEFWVHYKNKNRVFVIMSHDEYEHLKTTLPKVNFYPITSTINNILISNQASRT